MEAILTTFGIDWRLLLINALNFGLLLLALWYFLYAPVMKTLEERRRKVAQGVEDAESAKLTLEEIQSSRGAKLAQAGKEADDIVASARAAGVAKERELQLAGESAAANALREAELQAQELKHQAIEESKREVAKLIVLGIEKAQAK